MTIPNKAPDLTPYGETNLGSDLAAIDGLFVPNERFFVRSNGSIPQIDPSAWTLEIRGCVERSLDLTLDDLRALPQTEMPSFLECTGNGRSRFEPEAEGTPWKNDAVGNARWGGVRLRDVLDLAGVEPRAVEVVSQGADLATMQRGLPISVAMQPTSLLVTHMNGEPLPVAHGYPLRLLVPGWAGIASTKWLSSLTVLDHPFVGPFQGDLYVIYDADGTPIQPVREMPVKSIIASPDDGATVDDGRAWGFAWSGFGGIETVETSIDGGSTWQRAQIVADAGPHSWVRWEQSLDLTPGTYQLLARATDKRGLRQPWTAPWNQKGYCMNAIHRVIFTVGAG